MSKWPQIEQLLYGNDHPASDIKVDSFSPKDSAYISRLKQEINQTSHFIKQADNALQTFQPLDKKYIGSEGQSRRVVALYDTYGKLPFISDKDSVLGIATASIQTQELVKNHKSLIAGLEIQNSSSELRDLNGVLNDYQELVDEATQVNSQGAAKLRDLDSQIDQNRANRGQLIVQARQELDVKIADSARMSRLLSLHLKRVLTKFIAVQNWENLVTLDSTTLKLAIKQIMVMVDKLLNAPENTWIEILPTPITELLIKTLVMRDIVDSRDDSTPEMYYLKIRDFGLD